MAVTWTPAEDAIIRSGGPVPAIPGRTREAVYFRRKLLGVARRRTGETVKSRLLRLIRSHGAIPTSRLVMLARVESPHRVWRVWTELRRLEAASVIRRRRVRRVTVWELATRAT